MKILPQNPLYKFLAKFVFFYMVLALLKSLFLGELYTDYYRWSGEAVWGRVSGNGVVQITEGKDPLNSGLTTMIVLSNYDQQVEAARKGKGVRALKVYVDPIRQGWFPLSLLLCLILASPIRGLRRFAFTLGAGILLISIFVLFRQFLVVHYQFSVCEWCQVVELSSFWQSVLVFFSKIFIVNIVMSVIVPVLIWIPVTFKQSDLKELDRFFQKMTLTRK